MGQSRFLSFLFSFCLHASLVVLVLFWWEPEIPKIDLEVIGSIDLGMVSVGGPKAGPSMPSIGQKPPKGTEGIPAPTEPKPAEQPSEPTPPPPLPQDKAPVPTPPPPPPTESRPLPPADRNTAVPVKDPTPDKPKDPAPKPKEPVPDKPKDPASDKPKEPVQSKPKDPAPTKPTQTRPPATGSTNTPNPNAARDALSSLASDIEAEDKKKGNGGSPDGGSDTNYIPGQGGGKGDSPVVGSYIDSTVSRIKMNRQGVPRADSRSLVTEVHIMIAADGSITSAKIIKSSGNGFYDSQIMQAISATNNLERPPKNSDIIEKGMILIFKP